MLDIKNSGTLNPFKINNGEYPTPEVLNRPAIGLINNDLILEAASMMLARSGGAQLVTSNTKFLCHFDGSTKDVIGGVIASEEVSGSVSGLVTDDIFDGAFVAQDASYNLVADNAAIDSSLKTLNGWTLSGTKVSSVTVSSSFTGLTIDNEALKTVYPLYSDVYAPGDIVLTSQKYSIVGQSSTSASIRLSTKSNLDFLGVSVNFKIKFYTDTEYLSYADASISSNGFDGLIKLEDVTTPETATKAECVITINYNHLQASDYPSVACINLKDFMHCTGIISHTYAQASSDATTLTFENIINGSEDFSIFAWAYFGGNQINNYNLNYGPLFISGTPTTGTRSYTVTTPAVVGDTVTIEAVEFSCVASGATGAQFNVGVDNNETAANIKAALEINTSIADDYTITINNNVITLTEKISGTYHTPAEATCTGTLVIFNGTAATSSPNTVGIRHLVADKGTGKFTASVSETVIGSKLTIPESDYNTYRPIMLRKKTTNNVATVDLLILCSDLTLLKSTITDIILNSSYYSIVVGKDPNDTITPSYFNGGISELRYDAEWLNDAQFTMMALNELPFSLGYESEDLSWFKPNVNLIKNPDGKLGKNFWSDTPENFTALVEDVNVGSGFYWHNTSVTTADIKSVPVLLGENIPLTYSAKVKTNADTTGIVGIKLNFYSDVAGTTYIGYASSQAAIGGQETTYTVKATTPTGTQSVRAIMYVASSTSSSITWTKLKLERDSVATKFTDDYTPAYAVYAE